MQVTLRFILFLVNQHRLSRQIRESDQIGYHSWAMPSGHPPPSILVWCDGRASWVYLYLRVEIHNGCISWLLRHCRQTCGSSAAQVQLGPVIWGARALLFHVTHVWV